MRKIESFYSVEVDGKYSGYRTSIEDVNNADWMTPAEAEAALNAASADTPFPRRQYLVWRASAGLLPTKAREIVDDFGQSPGGRQLVYQEMPLLEEWHEPAWTAPHADFWTTGNLRLVRTKDSCRVLTTFEGIAFERAGIETVAELYAPRDNGGQLPTGDPGRPTKGRELYMAEFERRAGAGLAKGSAKLESEDLQDWFRVQYPTAALPTAKTIENNIRDRMRTLGLIT